MILSGALTFNDNRMRIIPHGRLHDQYQRGEFIAPSLLSFAALIIDPSGAIRYTVDNDMARLRSFAKKDGHCIVARHKPYTAGSPFLLTLEPVPWNDIAWLLRECELTALWWLKRSNDPEVFELPGIRPWLERRDQEHIRRLGIEEYAKQYKNFWGHDFP